MNERMPPGGAGSGRRPCDDESRGGPAMTRAKRNPPRGPEA